MLKAFVLLIGSICLYVGATSTGIPDGSVPFVPKCLNGGRYAAIEDFPFEVSIQLIDLAATNRGTHIGSGVIYNKYVILTAASVVVGRAASNLQIRAGSTCHKTGGQLIKVAVIKIHDCFDAVTLRHDIALLKLKSPLVLDGHRVSRAHIGKLEPSNNETGRVVGYGSSMDGLALYNTDLRQATIRYLNLKACTSSFYGYTNDGLKIGVFCGRARNQDSCQMDRGSPAMFQGSL
uniref:Peptidase S1 domain-containing protein n=1 Tax=Stomoxys calcitrans TaxID=35570 RepID=A0A1I8P5E9_STOCA